MFLEHLQGWCLHHLHLLIGGDEVGQAGPAFHKPMLAEPDPSTSLIKDKKTRSFSCFLVLECLQAQHDCWFPWHSVQHAWHHWFTSNQIFGHSQPLPTCRVAAVETGHNLAHRIISKSIAAFRKWRGTLCSTLPPERYKVGPCPSFCMTTYS